LDAWLYLANVGCARLHHAAARRRAGARCRTRPPQGDAGRSLRPLAPPFRSFGEKLYDTDMVQRLQDGLTTVHKEMPTFRFNREEAAAAVNYLRSIQKSK
jgi:hypothetical protein